MSGRLDALSRRAICVAVAHPTRDAAELARLLYGYGRLPLTPALERDFGAADDPMVVLDLTRGCRTRDALEASYDAATHPGWYGFARRGAARPPLIAKLYVSPRPRALGDAFPVIAALFDRFETPSFKVGRGLAGLLRPDKIVAYFADPATLAAVAAAIVSALAGVDVHGVAFTAELGGDGLVSWGVDPPATDAGPQRSWRSQVCERAAAEIVTARGRAGDPVAHVIAGLAAAGVTDWRAAPC